MELDEAYRILEVDHGASEEAVREARKTLAKVWHPDRHANDPTLHDKAQDKLADINAAFARVEQAGFPAKRPDTTPAAPKPQSMPPPPAAAPPSPPPSATVPPLRVDDFTPRRVRWSAILVLAAALGIGAYLAISKLGTKTQTVAASSDAGAPDAAIVAPADTAVAVVEPSAPEPSPPHPAVIEPPEVDNPGVQPISVRREKTFTLGSTRADVIAAMGQPQGTRTRSSTINGVTTASAQLTYGESSTIDFAGDRVVGWSEGDAPLHVRLDIKNPAAAAAAKARGAIAIGSSTDAVLAVLGPPSGYTKTRWSYGTSTIELAGGKVVGIEQGEPPLPVK